MLKKFFLILLVLLFLHETSAPVVMAAHVMHGTAGQNTGFECCVGDSGKSVFMPVFFSSDFKKVFHKFVSSGVFPEPGRMAYSMDFFVRGERFIFERRHGPDELTGIIIKKE